MSLVNLVQLICLEKQSAALILSKEDEDKGIIYFSKGNIIDASTGSLQGEDAVYEILTWNEGKFRLSSDVLLPRRVIQTSWDQILAEGKRRIEEMQIESKQVVERDEDLTSAEIEQDSALEIDLIYLLSKLEHSRATLTEIRDQKQPNAALHIFSDIMQNLFEMSQKYMLGELLDETLSEPSAVENGMNLYQVKNDLLSAALLKTDQDWLVGGKIFQVAYLQVGSSVVSILDRFFALVRQNFWSASLSDQWADTCAAFLDELTRAIQEYQL
jgi:hypothetical protein